jgi:tetratricopeptide (TPR) repeat protein
MSVLRRRTFTAVFVFCGILSACPQLFAQGGQRPRLRVDSYVIDAELIPRVHKLIGRAKLTITALDDLNAATFELHNGLRPTKVTNEAGQTLTAERVTQDSTLRVNLPTGLAKGAVSTLTFDYEGTLDTADDSPVEGLKLAHVGEDTSYLLYAGRWFPVSNYGLNRFNATIHVTVPNGVKVIGSGFAGPTEGARPGPGKSSYTFIWSTPSFPGTIIAGQFDDTTSNVGGITIRTYFKPNKKEFAPTYADTAGKEFEFFSAHFGLPLTRTLNIVELPDDSVPSAWAPEIVGLASRAISEKTNYRLLANTIARQWWGTSVSPVTRNDEWLVDGFARYSEVRYVENVAGQAGFEEATKDLAVGALAYDNVAVSSAGKLDPFSPEAQSINTDKGGIILHMLRWVMGTENFDRALKNFYAKFSGKATSTEQFKEVAEAANKGESLTSFFAQWVDGTGAPEFKNKYQVFRIKNGFRVVGEISQDLDLFRMPMEVRVETDGKPEMKRIEVVGTRSPYTVETFGKPRRIVMDPNNWVLKNSDELKVRVSIQRGTQLVAQGDFTEALKEYQKALDSNKNSSLAHYRIAEVFFLQRNYQSAANAYREAINGDGEPKWTEVWSYIQLGKIFDVTGQRERAVNSYRQALQTNDNTQGAQEEARRYLEKAYTREKAVSGD